MSTPENGIASNIRNNFFAPINISSSTNATPIVITSPSHGLTTGDATDVAGHLINTNANGQWQVTVLTSNTFSLNGSTGNGVGAATGTVQSLAIGPTFPIPADGVDNISAATFNGPYTALADRTAYLGTATGAFKFYGEFGCGQNNDTGAIWTSSGITTATTWTYSPSGIGAYPLQLNNVLVGDFVEVSLVGTLIPTSGGAATALHAGLMVGVGTLSNLPPTASFTKIGQSSVILNVNSGLPQPVHLIGTFTAGSAGLYQIACGGYSIGGLSNFTGNGDLLILARQYRPTGMPQ